MSTFKNLEEAKKFFAQDLFATENGMTLDNIGDDWAAPVAASFSLTRAA